MFIAKDLLIIREVETNRERVRGGREREGGGGGRGWGERSGQKSNIEHFMGQNENDKKGVSHIKLYKKVR